MSTSYTSSLGLALPVQGELSGQWGNEVNNYITTYLDYAIAGQLSISLTADVTLAKDTGVSIGSTSSQYAILNVTPSASTWTITVPNLSKTYVLNNLSSSFTFSFKRSGGTAITVAAAEKCVVAYNGTDFVKISNSGGSASFADLTLSGGTANGVAYLNASKVVTTGTALSWDATTFSARGTAASTITTGTTTNRGAASNVGLLTFTAPNASGTATTWGGIRSFAGNASAGTESSSLYFSNMQAGVATDAMVLNTSGNLGLGVTPSAWGGGYKAIQLNSTGAYVSNGNNATGLGHNYYYDGTSNRYLTTGAANVFLMINNEHRWYSAPAGTAGNAITFTQAMTLDASGRLGIGITSPTRKLQVQGDVAIGSLGVSGNYAVTYNPDTAGDTVFWTKTISNSFTFGNSSDPYSGGVELMRLTSGGNLLVGTTSTTLTSGGLYFAPGSNSELGVGHASGSPDGATFGSFRYANTQIGSITQSGTTAVAFNTSSDYRLKENIQPMQNALAKVDALKPVTYNWKADGSDGEGFIAHELAEVCPHAVTGEKDAVNEDGSIKSQGIDTSFLVATLTAALQEAHSLIKDLQTRVAQLEAK